MSVMLSFAAKYRPRKFEDVVGQDIVKKVVMNGLVQDRLSHSCLFFGPAGTGKTTFARLVALWLVCENDKEKPCLKCDNCKAALADSHPDIMEFDAATNTGIDDIQHCLETFSYVPQMSKYRIYIIDEVHMLSKSAISSLLKIIEEPQDHVWFLLATTEKDKIPDTILSRCLTFTLKSIKDEDMKSFLKKVCDKEKVVLDSDETLNTIYNYSKGSVRLALSVLEQASLIDVEKKVLQKNVDDICGVADKKMIHDLYEAVVKKNAEAIIDLSSKISAEHNPIDICFQLLEIAQQKKNEVIGKQVISIMETVFRSPVPEKVIGMALCYASYLNSLPTADNIWAALKQMGGLEAKPEAKEKSQIDKKSLLDQAKQMFSE